MEHFQIASTWEADDLTDEKRTVLKQFVTGLVGYPCKIACTPNNGSVDIFVFSEKKRKVTDWLELQPSGAIGVIYDLYKDGVNTDKLDDACEDYNEKHGFEFKDDSDSEGEEEEEEAEAEEQKNPSTN